MGLKGRIQQAIDMTSNMQVRLFLTVAALLLTSTGCGNFGLETMGRGIVGGGDQAGREGPGRYRVESPDGELVTTVFLSEGRPHYQVDRGRARLIEKSALGLVVDGAEASTTWRIVDSHRVVIQESWNPVWGKQKTVLDHATELTLDMVATNRDGRRLQVVVRAYDDGLAIRYVLPRAAETERESLGLKRELTEFRFAADGDTWSYNGEHRPLGAERLYACAGGRKVPMLVRSDSGIYLAIHEAALSGLGPMSLVAVEKSASLRALFAPTTVELPFTFPWRVVLVGTSPGQLVDSNLIVNLNPPCAIEDTSWIRPGVSFWDWRAWGHKVGDFRYGLDLPSWKRFVDLAAEKGIPYLLLDADWYGPEFDKSSDPTKGGKARDVQEILRYGKTRGVGLFLYINDAASSDYDLESVLKAYSDWGAVGIKYGFMKARGRGRVEKTQRIIELCSRHRLMCDFHDGPVHPSGGERTWPNCLTREFCHSQSDAHRVFTPETFCLQVFVNMLAGPIDMCNGLFAMEHALEQRPKIFAQLDSTITAEAARTLIVYSGLTVLPDSADAYRSHPELLAFLSAQRGAWAESRTLAGEIGKYIVMMRRTEHTFLVGASTNDEARVLELPLDFLPRGKFEAVIVEDTLKTHYQTNRESYQVRRRQVRATDSLVLRLAPGGGCCIRLIPRTPVGTSPPALRQK